MHLGHDVCVRHGKVEVNVDLPQEAPASCTGPIVTGSTPSHEFACTAKSKAKTAKACVFGSIVGLMLENCQTCDTFNVSMIVNATRKQRPLGVLA